MKLIFDCLLIVLLGVFIRTSASAQAGDFTYSQNETNVVITGYSGSGGYVVIPSIINGLPVTGIDEQAFYNSATITGVTIPGSVTSLGFQAFAHCSNLGSVSISDGITLMTSLSFSYCASLTNVLIPNSVTNISRSAFYCCSNLVNITIPDSVRFVGIGSFAFCPKLNRVFFKGNAPTDDPSGVFDGSPVTVYYLPGATGWTSTFAGCATALWIQSPKIEFSGNNWVVSWPQGVLLETTNVVNGPWATNAAASPLTVDMSGPRQKFYRVLYAQ